MIIVKDFEKQAIENFENYGLTEFIDFQQELRHGKQAIINIAIKLINGSELNANKHGNKGITPINVLI